MKLTPTVLISILAAASTDAYRFTAWSKTDYTGQTVQATTGGVRNLGFKAASYKWESPGGDGCCVKMCDGGRETGNWCPSRSNDNVAHANRFNKVVIGCGSDVLNC